MEHFSTFWTILEFATFLVVLLIFFLDPVRRWRFLGYRPTALLGVFDPVNKVVILAEVHGTWSFSQGAIYDINPKSTVKAILYEELGIRTSFKLISTNPVGCLKIPRARMSRASISSISIFRNLRGKGYMAYYVRIDNLKDVSAKPGTGIDSCCSQR